MYSIKVKSNFSAAHNLKDYKGKCEHLHGHNWNVEAVFCYGALGKDGIAVDFRDVKCLLKEAIEELDHSYLNELKILKGINPTSENIARFIYGRIKKHNRNLESIAVWENENSCATYSKRSK